MPRRPDFFSCLSREDLGQFETFARQPGRTVDACHEWLLARGYTASRSAVGRWKAKFDETDALSAASDLCDAINAAHAELGSVDLNKAMQLQVSQRLAGKLAEDGAAGDIEYLEAAASIVESLSRAGRNSTRHEMELIDLRARQKQAIQKAEAAAKTGASGADVVSTIKQALGLAA